MKENNQLSSIFVSLAALIILLAGIKIASAIIVQLLLALFITVILSPIFMFLVKKGVNEAIALTLVIILTLGFISLWGAIIGNSLSSFSSNLPFYETQLTKIIESLSKTLNGFGIDVPTDNLVHILDAEKMFSFFSTTLQSLGGVITNSFVIIFIVVFSLAEITLFQSKLEYISHDNSIMQIKLIVKKIKDYMALKAIISLVTAFLVWIVLYSFKIDYAMLWAVVAFLLNFIPNIGSLIAAVPAVLVALVTFGFSTALIIGGFYVLINTVIGSIIEPKVMGKGLGLSSLVVFLSLIFWGWLLGPIGMLLSIPLTIMVKISLEYSQNLKWMSVMLGDGSDIK